MNVVARHGDENVTFVTMAERTVGRAGGLASAFLYVFHNCESPG